MGSPVLDPRERDLLAEVARCRALLGVRADAVGRSAHALVDLRETFQKHPLGSILAAIGAGITVSAVGGRDRGRGSGSGLGPASAGWVSDLALGLVGKLVDRAALPLIGLLVNASAQKNGEE